MNPEPRTIANPEPVRTEQVQRTSPVDQKVREPVRDSRTDAVKEDQMAGNTKATITTLVGNRPTALASALIGLAVGIGAGVFFKAEVISQTTARGILGILGLLVLWLALIAANRIWRKR